MMFLDLKGLANNADSIRSLTALTKQHRIQNMVLPFVIDDLAASAGAWSGPIIYGFKVWCDA